MKQTSKHPFLFPVLMLLTCILFVVAAVRTDNQIPGAISMLLFALSGVSGGFSITGLAMTLSDRRRTPEEKRQIALAETDERNVTIREKAAMSSWYSTLYLLWVVFLICTLTQGGFYLALISVVIVLHCLFYLFHIRRWNKKM